MTLTLVYMLTQYRNALAYHLKDNAKCFALGLHIRIDMIFIDIHRNFFLINVVYKVKQLQLTEKCIPKFDFC